jgi:hypothetical protein
MQNDVRMRNADRGTPTITAFPQFIGSFAQSP